MVRAAFVAAAEAAEVAEAAVEMVARWAGAVEMAGAVTMATVEATGVSEAAGQSEAEEQAAVAETEAKEAIVLAKSVEAEAEAKEAKEAKEAGRTVADHLTDTEIWPALRRHSGSPSRAGWVRRSKAGTRKSSQTHNPTSEELPQPDPRSVHRTSSGTLC